MNMDVAQNCQEIYDRFNNLNKVRLKRAYQVMTGKQQKVLDIVTLLFHINHKNLPGFINDHTPAGIFKFSTADTNLQSVKQFAPSYHFDINQQTRRDIDALYLMGSCGSIAHSRLSDFDIWLCHRPDLDPQQVSDLQAKASKISRWAEGQGVELYFFVMSAVQFKDNVRPELSGEDCGSTQHKLLLDEFYRTALVLAGKTPLWWYIPPERDEDYLDAFHELTEDNQLDANSVLDFGPLASLPHEEFAGAAIWQMYKAIDSPYKSMIKILLSEVYAGEEQPQPLARDFKKYIYDNRLHADELDPYVMIYRRIERFLLSQGNTDRLEFIRRCFYTKIGIPLSQIGRENINHWRQQMIRNLCDQWRWGDYKLMEQDERNQWSIERVIEEQQLLTKELQNSFDLLQSMVNERQVEQRINKNELTVLSNKLHTWYDTHAEKITIISRAINRCPSLDKLMISRDDAGIWQLLRPKLSTPIYTSRSLQQLICWSEVNQLANNLTQYYIDPSCGDLQAQHVQIQRRKMHNILDRLNEASDNEAFLKEETFLACLFVIDSRETKIDKESMLVSDKNDVLKFGGAGNNLMHRVDIITCSSWHGLHCQTFEGQDSVIESLCYVLNNSIRHNQPMPEGYFTSFANQASALIQRFEQVYNEFNATFINAEGRPRFLMEIDQEYFVLEQLEHEITWRKFSTRSQLFNFLGQEREHFSPIVLEHGALRDTPLSAMLAIFRENLVQVLYQVNRDMAAIYINDERGSFYNYFTQYLNPQALLQPLFRFLNNVRKRQNIDALEETKHLYFYEVIYNRKMQRYIIDPMPTDMSIEDDQHFEVQAIVQPAPNRTVGYDIICGDAVFKFEDIGEGIYHQVAHFILMQRASRETYPIYLTDIDLSNCIQGHTQTIVYFQHKQKIERLLNQALINL